MRALYPYYIHSNYDLFQQAMPIQFETAQVQKFMNILSQDIASNISRLTQLEMSFYNMLDFKVSDPDAGFSAFVGSIKEAAEHNKQEDNDLYTIQSLIDIASNSKDFVDNWTNLLLVELQKMNVDSNNFDTIAKSCLKNTFKQLATNTLPDDRASHINQMINKIIDSTNVQFKVINADTLLKGGSGASGAIRNLRGGLGEIARGSAELILNRAVQGITSYNTGQLKYIDNGVPKELGADLVLEYKLPGKNGQTYQIGFQIKSYDISKKYYNKIIRIAGFNASESGKSGWLNAFARMENEGIINDPQFDALTYALSNGLWFQESGSYSKVNGKSRAVEKIKMTTNTALMNTLKQIFGMLSVRTATRDLNKMITPDGSVIGTVQLTKEDDKRNTIKNVNIPAVFWVISNNNFFPTRWILRDLQEWLKDFTQHSFSPVNLKIKYTGEPMSSPQSLFNQKVAAVGGSLKRPPEYTKSIKSVGDREGAKIAQGIQITADMAIIRSQLENIVGLGGLFRA